MGVKCPVCQSDDYEGASITCRREDCPADQPGAAAAAHDALADRLSAADRGDDETLPPKPAAVEQAPQPVDLIASGREFASFFGGLIREALPDRISAHWTDRRLDRLGVALGRCAQRYEWIAKLLTGASHPVGELFMAAADLGRPIVEPYVRQLMRGEKPVADRPMEEPKPAAPAAKPHGVAPLEDGGG